MADFDLHKFLINDQPYTFLFEVIVRVFIAYIVVFTFLKISGRRGVQQLRILLHALGLLRARGLRWLFLLL